MLQGALSTASLVVFLHATTVAGALSCGECATLQEGIWRSINHNISDIEQKAMAGTSTTATVEIGQIIWRVCESKAWKEERHTASLTASCKQTVREHVDTITNYWKEKSTEEYKDISLALRMKRAVCPNPEINACALEQLPSDYEPLRKDECAVCHALVSDMFGMVRHSRDRPKSSKSDAYYRLMGRLGGACGDMPMRHAMRAKERQDVLELCEEVWDEHEGMFAKLTTLPGDDEFARNLCADELGLCEEEMSVAQLFALDPPDTKEEL